MEVTFRSIPKGTLQRKVPVEVLKQVELRAVNEQKHDNEMLTELLCIGLGIDPAAYGIKPAGSSPCAN